MGAEHLRLIPKADASVDVPEVERRVDAAFRAFVGHDRFPCLAARGVARRRGYRLAVYPTIGSSESTVRLAADLRAFAHARPAPDDRLTAFVSVFLGRAPANEQDFERRLWMQLQRLHDLDDHPWDPAVADDPRDPRFSFSFGGRAFFVVGLHPQSSRFARRFRWPAIVFNPHAQFEGLRRAGRFERLRRIIRERDVALQGTPNPNLADFGDRSEARQYSGRDSSDPEWRCPFHRRDR